MSVKDLERMRRTRESSNKIFVFGETEFRSKEVLEMPVNIGRHKVFLKTEIVEGDIPWLLGRDTMEKMDMHINMRERIANLGDLNGETVRLRQDDKGQLKIKLIETKEKEEIWKEGWEGRSEKEKERMIRKLHLQFGHANGDKIWNLTEEAKWSEGLTEEDRRGMRSKIRTQIEKCEVCKKYKKVPARPVVGFKWSKTFNEVLAVDLGEWEGKKFLVMVDLATKYCQARWVKDKKPDTIMEALMYGWFQIFGAPAKMLSDNGGEFQNEKMRVMTERWNIHIFTTAAESPWSNGLCEKNVGLIKESLRKVLVEEDINSAMSLGWVVSARNCLMNNSGFSPNQLVFGKNPILPNLISEEGSSPASREIGCEERIIRENLNAMHKAREVFVKNESCNRIRTALNKNVREHKLEEAIMGEEVYYKREEENEWRGPAKIIGIEGKTVIVKHGDSIRKIAKVHITRIQGGIERKNEDHKKPEPQEEKISKENSTDCVYGVRSSEQMHDSSDSDTEEENENSEVVVAEERVAGELEPLQKFKKGDRVRAKHRETGEEDQWRILSLAGKRSSNKWKDSYNVQELDTGRRDWVDLREYEEIQKIGEEEEIFLGFEDDMISLAKDKEIKNWLENDVYEEVEDEGQKAISVRWIITEKMKNGERTCKARLVARGFEEEMEEWEKDAPTCTAETLKFCLCIIKQKNWECRTLDIKTAYLQGERIEREVILRPPEEFETGVLWRLNKTVYGLKDAAKAWYKKVVKIVEELGGRKCRLEPNIFFWKDGDGSLLGIMCSHVDDFCYGGQHEFMQQVIESMKEKLKVGDQEVGNFKYIGVNVRHKEEEICLDQKKYVESIKEPESRSFEGLRVLKKKELTLYRSVVGQLNWVAQHTVPEIAYDVSDLSRAFKEGTTQDMKKLIKVVRKTKRSKAEIRLSKLEKKNMFWEIYADASFGNIDDENTQIGYIISLSDGSKRCPIWWRSRKARRVAKATIEAEALSLGESLEGGIYFNHLWKEIVGGADLDVIARTDSKTLVKAIKSNTGVSSKRLKIDLAAIKEAVERGEVGEVEWVKSGEQIADVFTKRGVCVENLCSYVRDRQDGLGGDLEEREEVKLE